MDRTRRDGLRDEGLETEHPRRFSSRTHWCVNWKSGTTGIAKTPSPRSPRQRGSFSPLRRIAAASRASAM
jgi:hypothetical protein